MLRLNRVMQPGMASAGDGFASLSDGVLAVSIPEPRREQMLLVICYWSLRDDSQDGTALGGIDF